jgi:hypothetical protein
MAQEWFNDINDAVDPVRHIAVGDKQYSHDITAYSSDGKRCVQIYDCYNDGCGYSYLLIASTKINNQWSKGEVLDFQGDDGIDAMNDASGYLGRA